MYVCLCVYVCIYICIYIYVGFQSLCQRGNEIRGILGVRSTSCRTFPVCRCEQHKITQCKDEVWIRRKVHGHLCKSFGLSEKSILFSRSLVQNILSSCGSLTPRPHPSQVPARPPAQFESRSIFHQGPAPFDPKPQNLKPQAQRLGIRNPPLKP